MLSSFLLLSPASAQEQDDQSATELLSQYFDNVFGGDERLISGHIYYGPAQGSIRGHPYYFDDSWKNGVIETPTAKFNDLQVKFDITLNKVILKYTTTDYATYQIGLNSGSMIRIEIGSSEFIPLPGTGESTGIPFAEVISKGPVLYLITKEKSLEITGSAGSADYEYKEYMKQYLFHNGMLIPFRSKNTLYRTFPEIERTLKRYVRQNSLYLIKNRINERKKLIDHCNTLLSGTNE
ncbi:MAG: hypothetical protein JW965_09105 [Bacteroidales bacterium]|nr:hypothetical protein [Bacteroidales bacterium]